MTSVEEMGTWRMKPCNFFSAQTSNLHPRLKCISMGSLISSEALPERRRHKCLPIFHHIVLTIQIIRWGYFLISEVINIFKLVWVGCNTCMTLSCRFSFRAAARSERALGVISRCRWVIDNNGYLVMPPSYSLVLQHHQDSHRKLDHHHHKMAGCRRIMASTPSLGAVEIDI